MDDSNPYGKLIGMLIFEKKVIKSFISSVYELLHSLTPSKNRRTYEGCIEWNWW